MSLKSLVKCWLWLLNANKCLLINCTKWFLQHDILLVDVLIIILHPRSKALKFYCCVAILVLSRLRCFYIYELMVPCCFYNQLLQNVVGHIWVINMCFHNGQCSAFALFNQEVCHRLPIFRPVVLWRLVPLRRMECLAKVI